ncbi:hypothetical protein JVT61DRAFT_9278 [Boletus reticuloceps]|uniref:Uncharacterized protein n=1 Tax=Boletus reticuloceps TaxID=495285 RepID=A0A8I3A5T7_9AGAM|nr:hypothetical protein JVT61DRAFT_9278 [Boletus reticuloceps]
MNFKWTQTDSFSIAPSPPHTLLSPTMSFIQHRPGMLAKNLWDDKLVAALKTDSLANRKPVDPVPIQYEDICEWATVTTKPVVIDRTRPVDVLYKRPLVAASSTIYPVILRLQGFLGKHDLTLFGTWDG